MSKSIFTGRHPVLIAGCLLFLGLQGILLSGCSQTESQQGSQSNSKVQEVSPKTLTPQALFERGRLVYQTQCISCHNYNPRQAGSIGPEVFGSSKELLASRILKGEYPAGYTPKRNTHIMPALPHFKDEIDSLHAFLKGP